MRCKLLLPLLISSFSLFSSLEADNWLNEGAFRIWGKETGGRSPGFDDAYTTVGLQYLPAVSPGMVALTGYCAANLHDSEDWGLTVGPGVYWNPINRNYLIGLSLFYDLRATESPLYSQLGFTIESYIGRWRGLIHGYLPGGRRTRHSPPVFYGGYPNNVVVSTHFSETAMPVVEALLSRLFCSPRGSFDLQIGLYSLSPAKSLNYIGLLGRGRLEVGSVLFFEAQYSKDPWFHSRGQLSIGIQTRWYRNKRSCGCPCKFCPRPTQRKEWIVLDGCCNYSVLQGSL